MGAAAPLILQLGLQKADTTNYSVVRDAIRNLNEEIFMGRVCLLFFTGNGYFLTYRQVQFGVDHGNQMPAMIVQSVRGKTVVVAPPYGTSVA